MMESTDFEVWVPRHSFYEQCRAALEDCGKDPELVAWEVAEIAATLEAVGLKKHRIRHRLKQESQESPNVWHLDIEELGPPFDKCPCRGRLGPPRLLLGLGTKPRASCPYLLAIKLVPCAELVSGNPSRGTPPEYVLLAQKTWDRWTPP